MEWVVYISNGRHESDRFEEGGGQIVQQGAGEGQPGRTLSSLTAIKMGGP